MCWGPGGCGNYNVDDERNINNAYDSNGLWRWLTLCPCRVLAETEEKDAVTGRMKSQ